MDIKFIVVFYVTKVFGLLSSHHAIGFRLNKRVIHGIHGSVKYVIIGSDIGLSPVRVKVSSKLVRVYCRSDAEEQHSIKLDWKTMAFIQDNLL